jgi:hypothetical protein
MMRRHPHGRMVVLKSSSQMLVQKIQCSSKISSYHGRQVLLWRAF